MTSQARMFAAGLQRPVGWQPSHFLTDRAEAERAYALAEQLGSVNAAASQLGTTWPSLRKAFTRHGLGMPTPTPKPSANGPSPPPASARASPSPRRWTRCLSPSTPTRSRRGPRTPAELHQWVRRDEEYATLGANVVVELNSESRPRQPTTRAWAIICRADRAHRHPSDRQGRGRAPAGRPLHPQRPHQPIPPT
jgi:hypothetical protein